jgi:transcriptional regulator with XRE-family HTH domain
MSNPSMPACQGDLIRAARGALTQAEFAKRLGVHASCLSRYEREQLGAPTKVLNFCLKTLAQRLDGIAESANEIQRALSHVRLAAAELEAATKSSRSS